MLKYAQTGVCYQKKHTLKKEGYAEKVCWSAYRINEMENYGTKNVILAHQFMPIYIHS